MKQWKPRHYIAVAVLSPVLVVVVAIWAVGSVAEWLICSVVDAVD